MTVRRLCNVVYAHLIAGTDQETREDFDRKLYAPLAGWATVQQRILAIVAEEGGT